jgi:uridylate kinase
MPSIPEFDNHTPDIIVASIGGSVVRPNRLNPSFTEGLMEFSSQSLDREITPVYVVGGGGQARTVKEDLKSMGVRDSEAIDQAGIAVTEVNTTMIEAIMKDRLIPVKRYTSLQLKNARIFKYDMPEEGMVHLMGGSTPGQTSDTVAVYAALEANQTYVFNISDIRGIHPTTNGGELNRKKIISSLTWDEYRTLIPPEHEPGLHAPFDPVASKMAQEKGIVAVLIGRTDIFKKLNLCLSGKEFVGTVIHP